MSLTNEITLNEGEIVIKELKGPGYVESNNPFERLYMAIINMIKFLFGFALTKTIVVTNQRIFVVDRQIVLWKIPTRLSAESLVKRSILSVGYSRDKRFLLFSTFYFQLKTRLGNIKIRFKKSSKSTDERTEINALISTIIHYLDIDQPVK